MEDIKKVLLDTDLGSDIDDSVCLAYLLKEPRCQLLGITTASGVPVKRAMIGDSQCRLAGRNIPIYPGIDQPLLIEQKQKGCKQFARIQNWPHQTEFENNAAVDFMRKVIRANPGEISLLAVGPLTNIATLFLADREIPSLLKELVLMCGVFGNGGGKEWNGVCDPHATAVVYNAPVKRFVSVGLDVTGKVFMTPEDVKKRFTGKLLEQIVDYSGPWFEKHDKMYFHDPLAAAVLFDESICGYVEGKVTVEVYNQEELGATWFDQEGPEKPHTVAMTVDPEKFFATYFRITAE